VCHYFVSDAEAALIGNVADVRSKILSSLVSQFHFGGQLKEGMMPTVVLTKVFLNAVMAVE